MKCIKQVLVDLKLSQSNGESKRLIQQGAVKINQTTIKNKDALLDEGYLVKHPVKKECSYLIIFVGKKKYGLIELVP